jgi:WhiB family redox-sensing transcriptional regulator
MSRHELPAELAARVDRLRRLRHVPDAVLAEIVSADGMVVRQPEREDPGASTDRSMAARLCAGCPVQDECLELDLRWMADQTLGVFSGLTQEDRRALYPLWVADRSGGAR